MFKPLVLALALTASSAALPALRENTEDSIIPIFNGSNGSLDMDRRFSYALSFQSEPLDGQAFNMVNLLTGIHLAHWDPQTTIQSQQFAFSDYPGCVITMVNDARPLRPLSVRVVLYGLYEAVRIAATRPNYTEGFMTMYWDGKSVGVMTWTLNSGFVANTVAQEINSTGTDFVWDIKQPVNTTTLTAPEVYGPNDPLLVTTRFSSEVQLSSKRVFIVMMDALVYMADRIILPQLPIVRQDSDASALLNIGDEDERQTPPFLNKRSAIRTLGHIAEYYLHAIGWRETDSDIFYNRVRIGSVTIRAWRVVEADVS